MYLEQIKPQKGRFRQFMQCDIDILGDNSYLAEIDLVAATINTLTNIFKEVENTGLTVHINDRQILKAMARYAGFMEKDYDDVFISLDKVDKVRIEGVQAELLLKGYELDCITKFISIFSDDRIEKSCMEFTCRKFNQFLGDDEIDTCRLDNIDTIIDCVKMMIQKEVKVVYTPTLVRGMSYYTGSIFEISVEGYDFSIAGGGRYDEMVGCA